MDLFVSQPDDQQLEPKARYTLGCSPLPQAKVPSQISAMRHRTLSSSSAASPATRRCSIPGLMNASARLSPASSCSALQNICSQYMQTSHHAAVMADKHLCTNICRTLLIIIQLQSVRANGLLEAAWVCMGASPDQACMHPRDSNSNYSLCCRLLNA